MVRKYRLFLLTAGTILIVTLAYNMMAHATLFFTMSPIFMPSKEAIEKEFRHSQADLLTVTSYLGSLEYDSVYITEDGKISVSDSHSGKIGEPVKVNDQKVLAALTALFQKSGYNVISATPSKFVEFQRWSTRDKGCGIAYSFSDEKPTIEFLTELTPLSEPGWYYYVSDFDKYRRN